MNPKDRIIVALDVDSLEKAGPLIEQLSPYVGCFKIGLELLTAAGAPQVVGFVKERGGEIFFDGKFDDIPHTVAAAVKVVAGLGVKMFNVHASAGKEALQAAVANKGKALALAVTVLTSHSDPSARSIFGATAQEKVLQMAQLAAEVGMDGIVCSPQELGALQAAGLNRLLKVTPGVRPIWAAVGDQKRVMTPREAVQTGADYLVIGRPITSPPPEIGSSVRAVQKILEEIA